MLRHYLKMHESEDMIKTEAKQTWSERVNFTLRNRFSWTFNGSQLAKMKKSIPVMSLP